MWQPCVADHPPTDLKTVSFRCHNRSSARRPCPQVLQSHLRVAKQSSIGPSARRPCLQAPQSHLHVAKRSSDRSLAQRPLPQAVLRQDRVAKRTSIGILARRPSTEALLGQGRVAKGRESVPLTGLRSGSRPCSARHPRLQVVLRHPGVAKGTSIGTSARQPYQQAPQWHPLGATVSWCIG